MEGLTPINAETFQRQLLELSETIALKVDREGHKCIHAPRYVITDLFILVRYAQQAFAFISYLNADDRRIDDIYWREQYSVLGLTAVRSQIDCLYIITRILDDPAHNGKMFRSSGMKKFILNLQEDEQRYGSRPEWRKHLDMRKELLHTVAIETGIDPKEAGNTTTWKPLGTYLRDTYRNDNPIQKFLRGLTLGAWSDYSALSHASFEGLIPHAIYFVRDVLSHERRAVVKENFTQFITMHICRAAGLLLCILTEIQAYCHFDQEGTARINKRFQEIWSALLLSNEVKEFYDERYRKLMEDHEMIRKA